MKNEEYKAYKNAFKELLTKEKNNNDLLTVAQEALRLTVGTFSSFFRYRKSISEYVLSEIENQNVFLSSPEKFDDTFDSKCFVDVNSRSDGLANLYSTAMLLTENNEDFFGIRDLGEKQLEGLESYFDKINQIVDERLRIGCFTQKNNNIPMWYYYADEHKGICIEYDFSKLEDYRKLGYIFLPVVYPNVDEVNDYYELFVHDKNFNVVASRNALVKSNDWKFEKEWRIIKIVDSKDDNAYADIPIKAIYFGYNCSESDIKRVEDTINNNSLNIDLYKMKRTHSGLKAYKYTTK